MLRARCGGPQKRACYYKNAAEGLRCFPPVNLLWGVNMNFARVGRARDTPRRTGGGATDESLRLTVNLNVNQPAAPAVGSGHHICVHISVGPPPWEFDEVLPSAAEGRAPHQRYVPSPMWQTALDCPASAERNGPLVGVGCP